MATVNLVFFDNQSDKIEAYRGEVTTNEIAPHFTCNFLKEDVRTILKDMDIQIIVSPANCLGFMDGGIDQVYMELFPDIQTRVQKAIAEFDIETALGRKVLPIGSCKLVATLDKQTPLLACVPTMFLPENIQGLRNVYWSTRGLLLCLERLRNRKWPNNRINVAVPCFGTGVGHMSGKEAGTQVAEALRDHTNDPLGEHFITDEMKSRGVDWKIIGHQNDPNVILTGMACEQKKNYANTEIDPTIKPEDLVKRIELRSSTLGFQ